MEIRVCICGKINYKNKNNTIQENEKLVVFLHFNFTVLQSGSSTSNHSDLFLSFRKYYHGRPTTFYFIIFKSLSIFNKLQEIHKCLVNKLQETFFLEKLNYFSNVIYSMTTSNKIRLLEEGVISQKRTPANIKQL